MALFLVTGGAGFIGSNLVHELLRQGEQVRVIDNFITGRRENLAELTSQIELFEGSICEPDVVARAMHGVQYVLHQAALPSVPRSVADPLTSNDANITGTLKILLAARDAGVKRVVSASSSSVYGDAETLPKHENLSTCPLSPYALTKLAGEHYCRLFFRLYGLETVSLRYFNIFGPRQDPNSHYAAVIPRFINRMLQGKPAVVYGDGEQTRDFTFVQNAVHANIAACHAPLNSWTAMNIGCGERITINALIAAINSILGVAIDPVYEATRAGDVKHSQAAITHAQEIIGYRPEICLDEGLRQTVQWYQNPSR